jgi:hypothetical protein
MHAFPEVPRSVSGKVDLPLQVPIEKLHHDRIHRQLVLQLDDAVAPIAEGESLRGHAARFVTVRQMCVGIA